MRISVSEAMVGAVAFAAVAASWYAWRETRPAASGMQATQADFQSSASKPLPHTAKVAPRPSSEIPRRNNPWLRLAEVGPANEETADHALAEILGQRWLWLQNKVPVPENLVWVTSRRTALQLAHIPGKAAASKNLSWAQGLIPEAGYSPVNGNPWPLMLVPEPPRPSSAGSCKYKRNPSHA